MTTATFDIDDTTYVEIVDGNTDDALITNESSEPLRIIFADSLPAVGALNWLTLRQGSHGLIKAAGLPEGRVYARSNDGKQNRATVS